MENGQIDIQVQPQAVIDALMMRVQQLTMENVMLQAALSQRKGHADGTDNEGRMGSPEAEEQDIPA